MLVSDKSPAQDVDPTARGVAGRTWASARSTPAGRSRWRPRVGSEACRVSRPAPPQHDCPSRSSSPSRRVARCGPRCGPRCEPRHCRGPQRPASARLSRASLSRRTSAADPRLCVSSRALVRPMAALSLSIATNLRIGEIDPVGAADCRRGAEAPSTRPRAYGAQRVTVGPWVALGTERCRAHRHAGVANGVASRVADRVADRVTWMTAMGAPPGCGSPQPGPGGDESRDDRPITRSPMRPSLRLADRSAEVSGVPRRVRPRPCRSGRGPGHVVRLGDDPTHGFAARIGMLTCGTSTRAESRARWRPAAVGEPCRWGWTTWAPRSRSTKDR